MIHTLHLSLVSLQLFFPTMMHHSTVSYTIYLFIKDFFLFDVGKVVPPLCQHCLLSTLCFLLALLQLFFPTIMHHSTESYMIYLYIKGFFICDVGKVALPLWQHCLLLRAAGGEHMDGPRSYTFTYYSRLNYWMEDVRWSPQRLVAPWFMFH